MKNSIHFTCTALVGLNKGGELKPDSDGYRKVVLGALGIYNSAGEYYTTHAIEEIFNSSLFKDRVNQGRLRSELGHPKIRPNETERSFLSRIYQIEEKNVCAHIKEVYIDLTSVKDNNDQPVVAIIGKVIPSGPYADTLEKQFNNPNENVCFSVRGLSDDVVIRGINNKSLKQIITWDNVNDPGISVANKFKSPALESLNQYIFSRQTIESFASNTVPTSVALESAVMSANELCNALGWIKSNTGKRSKLLAW